MYGNDQGDECARHGFRSFGARARLPVASRVSPSDLKLDGGRRVSANQKKKMREVPTSER